MNEISDRTFRNKFFDMFCMNTAHVLLEEKSPFNLSFSEEEKDLIEYFMREMSPVHVSVHEEKKAIIEKFCADFCGLIEKNEEKLMIFEQAFKSSLNVLGDDIQYHTRVLLNALRKSDTVEV